MEDDEARIKSRQKENQDQPIFLYYCSVPSIAKC